MKENRIFIIALAVSAVLHFYLIIESSDLPFNRSGDIQIPVTFIPGAERDVTPEPENNNDRQITLPEDSPAKKGYYSAAGRDRLMKLYLEMLAEEIDKRKFSTY